MSVIGRYFFHVAILARRQRQWEYILDKYTIRYTYHHVYVSVCVHTKTCLILFTWLYIYIYILIGDGKMVYRLGFIVDFLSHASIVGFMGGAATVVCLQQLKSILGLVNFTHDADLVSVLRSVFSQTHEVSTSSLATLCHFFSPLRTHYWTHSVTCL